MVSLSTDVVFKAIICTIICSCVTHPFFSLKTYTRCEALLFSRSSVRQSAMSNAWLASVSYFISVRNDHRVGGFRSLKFRPSRGVWLSGRDSFTVSISSVSSLGCVPFISITNGSFHVGRNGAIRYCTVNLFNLLF